MSKQMTPRLTLVGAGPGDTELITLKGIKALEKADVVLYDALVNADLLEYAPKNALKVFVGKRAGKHCVPQEETNQLIVKYALSHGHVVRLKGGDPFVFGRGSEEIEYAESFGVETTIVPGISSALSVPALQRIPVTQRGASESFWVITGTTKAHHVSQDVILAAQSSATIVILMGMRKLQEITKIFAQHGKTDTPVAVIQNGSMPDEKIGIGTIGSIVDIVEKEKLGSPAIIVVGEVVSNAVQIQEVAKYLAA